jgi:RsiW-degrading membrane proteinase PrsW (M82 family)
MSFFQLSICFSALIGIIIIAWIRSFDIYEKETFMAMLWAFFVGGITSIFIAVAIYKLLGLFSIDDNIVSTAFGSFLIIGPVEEFAKLAGLVIVYFLIRKQFNEITDGIIYMSCVALGFSIIENYFYANSGDNNQYLLIYRAFISTPAHISFSCLIGYAWYRYIKENKSFRVVVIALLAGSILHGIFDALAFSRFVRFLLLIYLYIIMNQSLKLVQYSNVLSPFRPSFKELFDTPADNLAEGRQCPYCKSSAPKALYSNRYFTAYRCHSCGFYICSVRDIEKIFRIFAPEYKRFTRKIVPVRLKNDKDYLSVYGAAFFEQSGRMGFFMVDDVAKQLQLLNETLISHFRKTSIFSGNLLKKIFE